MKKRLIKLLHPLLNRLGMSLHRKKDYQRLVQSNSLMADLLHRSLSTGISDKQTGITFIIFSKDRALQLDGLLQSMLHHVSGTYSVKVLYHASDGRHLEAYEEVSKRVTANHAVEWTQESNFCLDLVNTLRAVTTEFVCFLVDDIIFIRPFNPDTIDKATMRIGIVSLRLGPNIHYCYTKQRGMQVPRLSPINPDSELLQFNWNESNCDWAYPLSVDGHIFPTAEIAVALQRLSYNAPNTLERSLQILKPLYLKRLGYCFDAPRILNIPINRVQKEVRNISGEVSPEYLLEKWQAGWCFDFKTLSNTVTTSAHEERAITFTKREATDSH